MFTNYCDVLSITGEYHAVTVGGTTTYYNFNDVSSTFEVADIAVTGAGLEYGTDFTYPANTGLLTILSAKSVTLSGATTTDTVFIPNDVSANVTLSGLSIDVSAYSDSCAFEIENCTTGNVTLTLAANSINVLKSGYSRAGLQKTGGGEVVLGELTITGTGTLNTTGGDNGAGIGGNFTDFTTTGWSDGSDITIAGGTVIATGGYGAAGIGGGYGGQGRYLTITGGNVTATGNGGAGIGGGQNHIGEYIIINGGIVTASSDSGYGIGSADGCSYEGGDSFVISGGSVKISSDYHGSEIGKGTSTSTPNNKTDPVYLLIIDNPNGGEVTIDGAAYSIPYHSEDDKKLYVYLTGTGHEVTVDGVTTTYTFNGATFTAQ